MITASHNPVQDNGMKIVDSDGGMLAMSWEGFAAELANEPMASAVAKLQDIAKAAGVQIPAASCPSAVKVVIGCDTRPSSALLRDLVKAGAEAVGVVVEDIGVVPTPVVHHVVRCTNSNDSTLKAAQSVQGYYDFMATALADVLGSAGVGAARAPLRVDCASGVGSVTVAALDGKLPACIALQVVNGCDEPGAAGQLNDACGAEYAQKQRLAPRGFDTPTQGPAASLDGDADRVVYHYYAGAEWRLLDGDAIATLAAAFVQEQISALGWSIAKPGSASDEADAISVGVVQTAYANGASTAYIRDTLQLPIAMARTGVKFVHHAATAYDIGIYFEANGHGTVLFSDKVMQRAKATAADESAPAAARAAAVRLEAASRLINQAVGDAVSDVLFCEAVLVLKGWELPQWDALYNDLPSRQLKVKVPDRDAFKPNDSETRLLQPEELQASIDAAVAASGGSARAFVRPSGTEDVVRIYAEADDSAAADALAAKVQQAIVDYAGQ